MDHKSKSECLGVASGRDIIIVIILGMSHMPHHHCIGQQFPQKNMDCAGKVTMVKCKLRQLLGKGKWVLRKQPQCPLQGFRDRSKNKGQF